MNLKKFDHKEVEKKWLKIWADEKIYQTPKDIIKKCYVLDMFPYPSGASMHVGHLEGYVGTDILTRYLRMNGYSVLHPMGWDAFGLPAENYAIKTGIHPDESTHKNITTFKQQLINSGLSYDWDNEFDTSSPEFYKWTQWLFILMFKKGLAYKQKASVNWCPKDETVLANEQVVDGHCERCGTEVIQKELEQWFFRITNYADRLISGLDKIDWPDEVKRQQINWIGKKEGVIVHHKVIGKDITLDAFSAYPAWLFADTFLVIAPLHPIVSDLVKGTKYEEETLKFVEDFKNSKKDNQTKLDEKKGIFTGCYVVEPFSGNKMPVWLANFALMDFGTGIIRCSAHDLRDYEFATKYKIPLKEVVERVDPKMPINAHENEGILIDSGPFSGKNINQKLILAMIDWIVKEGIGQKNTSYHLRDWLISRQRYWGCPIPMVYCEDHKWQPTPDSDLPILLPKDVDFLPHGESPIARSKTFQKGAVCPTCGKTARREVDTMDTYVDSSWYFIRFVDPKNIKEFASAENIKKWLPVDDYVGGGHVVQHLLFARFFWKVLFDENLIAKNLGDEPFLRLRAPGWILGPDSRKMSKRWGNVITPDEVIPKFGADTLRVYEMFMGPFDVMKPWSITGIEGMRRFMDRIWTYYQTLDTKGTNTDSQDITAITHQTIKKVTEDIEEFRYNIAISSLMVYFNALRNSKNPGSEALKTFLLLLAPFAPFMTEELWQLLSTTYHLTYHLQPKSIHFESWPKYNPELIKVDQVVIVVQVNGKLRSQLTVKQLNSLTAENIEKIARDDPKVNKWLSGQLVKKVIFVPGKLINFVTS